jgi:membrane carboxypeptidase/penicillin-binding protein
MAEIGPAEVVGYAKRFGLSGDYQPFLSVALGAVEATLVEITSAYSAFPNKGVRMEPYSVVSIADREGNLLEEHRPESHEAIRADTAFVMTNLLRGVVLRGTAEAARSLDWPLAGKTGTMDEYTDAWFVGFDPRITVGVWVGYDEKKPLGNGETGAVAALPIWMISCARIGHDRRAPQFGRREHRVRISIPALPKRSSTAPSQKRSTRKPSAGSLATGLGPDERYRAAAVSSGSAPMCRGWRRRQARSLVSRHSQCHPPSQSASVR